MLEISARDFSGNLKTKFKLYFSRFIQCKFISLENLSFILIK